MHCKYAYFNIALMNGKFSWIIKRSFVQIKTNVKNMNSIGIRKYIFNLLFERIKILVVFLFVQS